MYLDWAVLAVSFYNTISLFWLGLTVLLNGDRRVLGTWISGGGLVLGGVLFVSHTAIMGRGLSSLSLGMTFWWWVSWVPAIAAPLAWYGVMLWHAGFHPGRPHPHRAWLLGVVALLAGILAGLILSSTVSVYRYLSAGRDAYFSQLPGVALLFVCYLLYSLLCYLLPLDLLRRPVAAAPPITAVARRQARPWLAAVSALLLLAGVVMTGTAVWALLPRGTLTTLANPTIETMVKRFDLAVAGLVAAAVTLLGRAIVGYAVFTGHLLPRRGFFRQWRSTVILAAGFSLVVSVAWVGPVHRFYGLLLAALVMTLFHVLSSWRAFAEREQFMAQIGPFVASQGLYDRMREGAPPDPAELESLFATLCRDVLGARAAVLVPAGSLAALAGPPLVYAPGGTRMAVPPLAELTAWFPASESRFRPAGQVGAAWAVALRQGGARRPDDAGRTAGAGQAPPDALPGEPAGVAPAAAYRRDPAAAAEPALGGVLLLGEKLDGNPYTEEELELAQAGGERLLDTLAGMELAGVAMRLLRERVAQVKVLENQGRRILHDQVLPRLHTAILQLSARRGDPAVSDAVVELTAAHREISDLMRDVTANLPRGLAQQGLAAALRGLVQSEFGGEFNAVAWEMDAAAEEAAGRLAPFVAEVVYFAARELLRNAACHGRGGDVSRPLRLRVGLEASGGEVRLAVEDNGVGVDAGPAAEWAGGSGSGLRFHSTMLAAVGGRLEVLPLPDGGTRGVVAVPGG